MKMKKNIMVKYASMFLMLVGVGTQPAFANHGVVQHAANSCFPRVFSQIDQFLVSSGGLRNSNANSRSIICSIDSNALDPDPEFTGMRVFLGFEQLDPGQEMSCTLYTRSAGTGALLDSVTTVFDSTNDGTNAQVGTVDWLASGQDRTTISHYVQCAVPCNGRVFMTRSFYVNEVI